jgi:DNA-binding PadR family transcriptional regulator
VTAHRSTVPRLSVKEAFILDTLARQGESYGLQLVTTSKGRLKRGTVYVTLGRMEDKGYVVSHTEDAPDGAGGLPRRLYEATPFGLRVLKAWTTFLHHLAPEPAR